MADDVIVRFRDFSLSEEPVTFRIAPDTFECWPEIPLDTLTELTGLGVHTDDRTQQLTKMYDFFDSIMTTESAAVFRRRCRKGTDEDPNPHPVGMRHIRDILPWLMEVYGLRPTQPSDESSDGSAGADGSSTDGVSNTE